MQKAPAALLCACLMLASTTPLFAQIEVEVLRTVPDSALGVVVVNRLKNTSERLEKLGRNMQIAIPSPLGFAKAIVGLADGIDESASLAVAFFPGADGRPPVGALFIPINDFEKFLAPLNPKDTDAEIISVTFFNRPALVARKRDFAVLVDEKYESLLKDIKNSTSSIEKGVAPLSAWLGEQSIAGLALEGGAVVALDWVQESYKRVEAAEGGSAQGEVTVAAMQEGIKQLKGEVTHFGVGFHLGDRGLTLSAEAAFKPAGKIAQAIRRAKWPAAPGLDALPSGTFVFAAAAALPRSWLTAMANAKLNLLETSTDVDEDQQQKLSEAMADMVKPIQSVALLVRPPMTGRSFLNQLTSVLVVDDAPAFLAAYEKDLQTLEKQLGESKAKAVISRAKKIDLEGMTAVEADVDFSPLLSEAKESDAPATSLLETLVGSVRQLTAYLVAVDKHRIIVSYGSRSGAVETAKLLRSGKSLAADPDVQKAVGLLPKDPNWLGLIDLTGAMQLVNHAMPAVAPNAHKLPEFRKTQPAVASVQFMSERLAVRFVLPSKLLEKIGSYAADVRDIQQGD